MSAKVLIPTVSWAQRKDVLFITLDVQDVKGEKVSLNNVDGHGVLTFSGTAGAEQEPYALDLKLLKEIDLQNSKVSVSPRSIFLVLAKTEEGHWPRLTEAAARQASHVKVDWNKWVDEDEEDAAGEMDMSGFNFSDFGGAGMGGLGGEDAFGGPGGAGELGAEEDEDDSDAEELPDLVK